MSDLNKFVQPISEFCKGMLVGGFIVAGMIWFVVLLSGCAAIKMTTPEGATASYVRFGDQQIQGFRMERDNLGVWRVVLEKQSSEARILDAIGALVGAAK